jgi:predicted kinase
MNVNSVNFHADGSVIIPENTLVILSGLPASGKTGLRLHRAVNADMAVWVSSDAIRDSITPLQPTLIGARVRFVRNESANPAVFAIMRQMVRAGLQMGRTVVVDATSLTDADRKDWVDIADEEGVPHLVLILDTPLETCLSRAEMRPVHVGEATIRRMHQPPTPEAGAAKPNQQSQKGRPNGAALTAPQGFQRDSQFRHAVLGEKTGIWFTPNELPEGDWDVVGDTHGLLDELIELLTKAGWPIVDGRLLPHPQGRKLLFLGDLVDRGTQSIALLRFLKKAVDAGLALCIKGNHDAKLVRFVRTALLEGIERWTSFANAETGMEMLKLDPRERDELVNFLHRLPAYYVDSWAKTVFVHADMHTFAPGLSLKSDCVYGMSGWSKMDSDGLYQQGVAAGLNEHTLVRGHYPATSEQSHAFSLERHPFQKGELVLLRFDEFRKTLMNTSADRDSRLAAFTAALVTQQCEFDFAEYSKRYDLIKGLEKLVEDKFISRQLDDSKMLRVYKYSKQTFWNNSWGESELLLKARGLVLDPAGNIVSHPLDKCFNYLENGTGADLSDDLPVIGVEKLNGFLGIISAHPLNKGELLVHTQGGFGGPFVQYIRDFITPAVKGQLLKYLSQNDVTLMFEVLHESDPHIVAYPKEMMGLHLLAVRGKKVTDKAWKEDAVDVAGAQMGLRRAAWRRMTFGEAREFLRTTQTEGLMVRADTDEQEYLLKGKSPHYLTVKFLGRLSTGKIKYLFANPRDFKKTMDEEYYVIIDKLVETYTPEQFQAFTDDERVSEMRNLINSMQ